MPSKTAPLRLSLCPGERQDAGAPRFLVVHSTLRRQSRARPYSKDPYSATANGPIPTRPSVGPAPPPVVARASSPWHATSLAAKQPTIHKQTQVHPIARKSLSAKDMVGCVQRTDSGTTRYCDFQPHLPFCAFCAFCGHPPGHERQAPFFAFLCVVGCGHAALINPWPTNSTHSGFFPVCTAGIVVYTGLVGGAVLVRRFVRPHARDKYGQWFRRSAVAGSESVLP